jgi:hypothetical protein
MVVAAFARFHERVFKIAEDISDVVTGRQTELRGIAAARPSRNTEPLSTWRRM